jgi:DNA-binding response OmpR family regulator
MKKPVILIVDDNREMLEYLNIKFSVKYKILQASNGEKALSIAIEKNPDLIITDLMMPEMDGIELCKRIKTDINTSHIPIIILTAKTTEESAVEGLETGADVFLSKPFNVDVLKAQIKTLLESREKMKMNFARELILQPKNVTVTSTDERFLKKLMDVVEQNIGDVNFGIKELTLSMGMSHSVIFRKTKSLTGLNVVEFIRSIRLKKAALILKNNKLPIAEVSYMVGFSDPKYFSKCFIKEFGVTPSEHASRSIENDNAVETNNNLPN